MGRNPIIAVVMAIATASTAAAHAGPMLPCLAATLSAHGTILVVNDLTYEDPDETHIRTIKTSTFRVIRRYVDQNRWLAGPDTYWADPMWELVFQNDGKRPFEACSYTLVTDDGEYLILVASGLFDRPALSIYRRRDHPGQPFTGPGPDHGVLVRQIAWSDLWPAEYPQQVVTDQTPKWFAGGTFAFSPDDRKLIYKAASRKSVQISLPTGQITH